MQSDVNNRKNKDSVGSKVEVTESPNIFALVKTHKHTHTFVNWRHYFSFGR